MGILSQHNFPCGPCAAQAPRVPYRRVVGAAHYADAVEEAVKLLKFHDKQNLVMPLAHLLIEAAHRELTPSEYTLIVPVPLHRVRHRERGYNQAQLLAEAIAPVFPNARLDTSLIRIRPTHTQSRLRDPDARRRNVRGAFAVKDGRTAALRGAAVLLLDDVVTTRGTVGECARILRRKGAVQVDVLAVALATGQRHQPHPAGGNRNGGPKAAVPPGTVG